jgi:predicted outer membrane protein
MATDHALVANRWLEAILAKHHLSFQPSLTPQDQELGGRLKNFTGARFDDAYTEAQIAIDQMTIETFQNEARAGQDRMLRLYAEALLPVLQQHLAEAETLESGAATEKGSPATLKGEAATAKGGGSNKTGAPGSSTTH